jgi:hypothetical protein
MAKNAIALPTFDYDAAAVEKTTASKLISLSGEINRRRQDMASHAWEIGKVLADAHELLANHHAGTWGKWVEGECGFSRRTAERFVSVYHAFPSCDTVSQLEPVAAYRLSAPDTPEGVRKKAIKLASQGHRITDEVAKQLISPKKAKPKPKRARAEPAAEPAGEPNLTPPSDAQRDERCPNCSCLWWVETEGGQACWKCQQPWGEPADEPEGSAELERVFAEVRGLLLEAVKLADKAAGVWAWEESETLAAIRQLYELVQPKEGGDG